MIILLTILWLFSDTYNNFTHLFWFILLLKSLGERDITENEFYGQVDIRLCRLMIESYLCECLKGEF
jgi:hypothetical protein